jgi:integrase
MGSIYQRTKGGTYYGYWTDQRGRAVRKSLRTRDAAVARARLRTLELAATDPAAHSHHTLTQAVDNLLALAETERAAATHSFYQKKAGHLMRVLGAHKQLADISRDDLLSYVKQRRLETAVNSTIHKELTVLRRALEEAKTRKLWNGIVGELVPTVKVSYQPRQTWLSEHQAKQVLARVAADRRLWFMLATWGGLCKGEVERLDWKDVDLAKRVMLVRGTKRASRFRSVPIAPLLAAALRDARPEGERRGLVAGKWSNAIRGLARAAELAQMPAELRKLTPNDLRRTFASLMLNAGVSALVVAKLLGHASTKMVELVYGQISAQTMRGAVAMLPLSDADHCAAGEQSSVAVCLSNETTETSCFGRCDDFSSEFQEVVVPRDGVEPPTRGFSGLNFRVPPKKLRAV